MYQACDPSRRSLETNMLAWLRIGSRRGLVGCLPRSHLGSCLIEETREVSFAHLLACFWSKQIPQRPILVEDLQIALLACGRDFVSAEQKAIREAMD